MCHPRTTSCLVAKCPVGAQWQRQDASPLQPSHVVQRQSLRHHVDVKCKSRMTPSPPAAETQYRTHRERTATWIGDTGPISSDWVGRESVSRSSIVTASGSGNILFIPNQST